MKKWEELTKEEQQAVLDMMKAMSDIFEVFIEDLVFVMEHMLIMFEPIIEQLKK